MDIAAKVEELRNSSRADYTVMQPYIEAYNTDDYCNQDKLMDNIVLWSLWFIGIGVANFIGFPTFSYMFGKSGEELTSRLRYKSLKVKQKP